MKKKVKAHLIQICRISTNHKEIPLLKYLFALVHSIYKATKCLLQKVCFVFSFLRQRKTAAPLLPIRNPASTALSQPLLLPSPSSSSSPRICSPNHSSSLSIFENTSVNDLSSGIDDDAGHCENDHELLVSEADEIKCSDILISPSYDEELVQAVNSPCSREEDVKNIVGVAEKERRIKHYKSSHKILLVGEGDFSFSACLALTFVSAPNIIATSLNSKAFLKKHYGKAMSNIAELRSRGSKVMHGIDATDIANHELLRRFKFDRIVFNFPFAGFFRKLSTQNKLRRHRRLVSLFLKNAKELISEDGEIHISHKTNGFHADFKLESIASSHGLRLIQAVNFKLFHYPGYDTKFGFGGDGNFNCYPSKTFKFALK